jgi:hypothetical protein
MYAYRRACCRRSVVSNLGFKYDFIKIIFYPNMKKKLPVLSCVRLYSRYITYDKYKIIQRGSCDTQASKLALQAQSKIYIEQVQGFPSNATVFQF